MSDDFDRILRDGSTQFSADLSPPEAHLVRARGDQRRKRKTAGSLAIALLIVVGSGTTAYALGQPGRSAPPVSPATATATPTPGPTMTHTPTATPTATSTATPDSGPSIPSTATTSLQPPAKTAPTPHLVGCGGPSVRPTSYNPICNDGAGTVIHLQWSSWSSSAEGQGEFYTHTCVPDCATGKVQLYSVDVTAWQVSGGDYTRFSYYFPHSVPPGFSRSWTIDYDLGRWTGRVV